MSRGLILEGVTGAGKSQTLAALQSHAAFPTLLGNGRIFLEEETLGEVMDELDDPQRTPAEHCWRLERVLAELERDPSIPNNSYLLERFHLSYYALLSDWSLVAAIDRRLAALDCKLVLLTYTPDLVVARALERADRQESGWSAGMDSYFGTRAAAIEAVQVSQQRRIESLELTMLPYRRIDTSAMDWAAYAAEIGQYWQD